MSPDNFMEVAESLSDIFGISKEAFQRVDFEYLAEAISQMDVNSSSLDENLALLASGETTTTAEQLRMQQINEYMIDEGLSYVLDNEAARAIQQHMWDEQIANEIMEAEYGVNIQGTALEFLSGISTTIDNILNFLNPFRGISRKLTDLTASIAESYAEEEDIAKVLELGKVGNGNATAFAQLTTRGTDLNLTDSLVSLLGGHSSYETIEGIRKISQTLTGNSISNAIDNKVASSLLNYTTGALTSMSLGTSSPTSSYKWGTVGKSTASALSSLLANSKNTSYTNASVTTSGTSSSQSEDDKKIAQVTEIVSGMAEWYKNNGTETRTDVFGNEYTVYRDYEDWVSDSGLSKVSDYIEDAGFTEQQLQEAYENMQSQSSAQEELDRIQREQEFYSIGIDNLPYLPQIYEELYDQNENTLKVTIYDRLGDIYDQLTDQNTQTLKVIIAGKLDTINSTLSGFVKSWTDYYVNHTTYNNHLGKSLTDQITAIQSEEKGKSDTAISRLADVLTQTASDLADPTVQTNVLLAEVLKVVTTIMQQNNNKTTSTQLGTSLSALALGLQT
jgi:DNA-binding SARP family transcriptional activator